jgi:hypothetical protein
MSLIPIIPWSFSATTAVAFALMARRSGRNWFQWASLGAVGSLAITTATLGAAEAAFIPVSDGAYAIFCTKATLVAMLLNLLPGWLITADMHLQHVALLEMAKRFWAKLHSGPTSEEAFSGTPFCERIHRKANSSPARPASHNKMV